MKNKLLLFLFLFTSIFSQSQTFEWLVTPEIEPGANGSLLSYATTFDPSGNVYMTGYKENKFLYGAVFGDNLFNKYDASGNLIFTKMINGHVKVENMISDHVGNILMAVTFVQTITIGTFTITNELSGIQAILLKFDTEGNLIFHDQPIATTGLATNFSAIATDDQNNIYVGYSDGENTVIQKRTPSGAVISTISQQNIYSVTSIDVDIQDNIYVAGACAQMDATFAGVNVNSNLQYNCYVVKYDASGTFQWVKFVEDITCSTPAVKVATPNDIYFSSTLFGSYLFDSIQTDGPEIGAFTDVFIAKLNSDGAYQWVREVPGSTGSVKYGKQNFLETDTASNVFFVGSTRGAIQWTPTISTVIAGFSDDGLILKFDTNGELRMAKTAGGSSLDGFDAIAVNDLGELAVTGISYNTATFDSFTHQVATEKPYPILGKISSPPLGMSRVEKKNLIIYPNPSNAFIQIANTTQNYEGTLFNMMGQKVMQFEIGPNLPVSVQMLPKGTYLLKLVGERSQKFIRD